MHPRPATSQAHENPENPSDPEQKEIRRQAYRLKMSALVVVNMLLESATLALFAYAGTISYAVAGWFFVLSMLTSGGVHLYIRRGYNLGHKNRSMLVPQMLLCGAVQVLCIFLAPNLTIFFLLVIIAFSGYAAIEFTPREFTISWLAFGIVSAAALWLVRDRFAYPGVSDLEIVLVWVFFFLTLRQLSMAGVSYSRMRDKLSETNKQLQQSLKQIEELASHDALTGVLNRRRFMEMLEAEMQRSERFDTPFCFVMLDLDLFKTINDRYGHPVGDAVLQTTCSIALGTLRSTDVIGRLGGEEFGIVLTGTAAENGLKTMERLRKAVFEHGWDSVVPGLMVSFSAGLAGYVPGESMHALAKRADEALYRAKHAGRNRVVLADAGEVHAVNAELTGAPQ
ncbi:GGDEF domain-containing protein [Noviherbaspirillum agri]